MTELLTQVPAAGPVGADTAAPTVPAVLADAMLAVMLDLGARTGLTAALAAGPADAAELAERTGGDRRIAAEWLRSLAAGGLVAVADDGRAHWSPAAGAQLGQPASPADMSAGVQLFSVLASTVPAVAAAFTAGNGLRAEEYPAELATAMARMSDGWTASVLPGVWVPVVPGLAARLAAGGAVAEIGCGAGHALEALCARFPAATATGFDLDARGVTAGRRRLAEHGGDARITLHATEGATGLRGPYDCVLALSVLHDATDLPGLLAAVAAALAPDGYLIVVEAPPLTGPFAAMLLATSTLYCVPTTAARGGADPLGTLGLPPDVLVRAAADAGLVPGVALPQVVPMAVAQVFRRAP